MGILRKFKIMLYKGSESCLLIEQTEGGYSLSQFSVSEKEKRVVHKANKVLQSLDQFGKIKYAQKKFDRIILALNASEVATIESSISVTRVHPDTLITEGELDGLLFHALWSFLNKFRPLAAKKLNTTELDLVIANIAVFGVKLQGHSVFNPLDFSGKDIEFFFRVSFVSRSLLPLLERITKFSRMGPVVVERGAVFASIAEKPGILFVVDKTKTNWYEMGDECGFRNSFNWGFGGVYESLGELFGVSPICAPFIIKKFGTHRISPRISGAIEKTIRDEYKKFSELADESQKEQHHELLKGESRVIHFEDQLISSLFLSDERYRISDGVLFSPSESGWDGDLSPSSALAVFPYAHPQYEYLNQLLRRRAKWLVPLDVQEKK